MREALIILAVLLIILALTAFKYRKQIKSVVGVSRMIRNAAAGNMPQQRRIDEPVNSSKLVNCYKVRNLGPGRQSDQIRYVNIFLHR